VITNTFGKKNHILTPDITLDTDIYYETDKVNVGGNLNYRSEMFVNLENTNTIPYLLTVNAYASYKFTENVECGLRWNNITNRVNYSNGAVGPNGETLYFRNAPSNVNVYFKYIF
jgi:outer membrane receptor for ferric coprogen and ferric-rhodotorulic acid